MRRQGVIDTLPTSRGIPAGYRAGSRSERVPPAPEDRISDKIAAKFEAMRLARGGTTGSAFTSAPPATRCGFAALSGASRIARKREPFAVVAARNRLGEEPLVARIATSVHDFASRGKRLVRIIPPPPPPPQHLPRPRRPTKLLPWQRKSLHC